MEGHRREFEIDGVKTTNILFQSLFLWKVIVEITTGAFQLRVFEFQSLFLWKVIVEQAPRAYHWKQPGFNPCFYGRSS